MSKSSCVIYFKFDHVFQRVTCHNKMDINIIYSNDVWIVKSAVKFCNDAPVHIVHIVIQTVKKHLYTYACGSEVLQCSNEGIKKKINKKNYSLTEWIIDYFPTHVEWRVDITLMCIGVRHSNAVCVLPQVTV